VVPEVSRVMLRAVLDTDDSFLRELYASTRQAELALMPWPEEAKASFVRMQFEAQRSHYFSFYPQADHFIVLADGASAGRLYVDRQDSCILIVDITVLPEFHRRGIGRALVSELQSEAVSSGRVLTGHVEKSNPASAFWRHMGFHLTDGDEMYSRISWTGDAHDGSH
jgi:GNAT superfamily N-acetyltransferase